MDDIHKTALYWDFNAYHDTNAPLIYSTKETELHGILKRKFSLAWSLLKNISVAAQNLTHAEVNITKVQFKCLKAIQVVLAIIRVINQKRLTHWYICDALGHILLCHA